jgi:hypothetical protein
VDSKDPKGVLHGQAADCCAAIYAKSGTCFNVSLYPGAAGGIGAGNGQDNILFGFFFLHNVSGPGTVKYLARFTNYNKNLAFYSN